MNCVILIERPFGLYIELQEDTPNPRLEGYDYNTLILSLTIISGKFSDFCVSEIDSAICTCEHGQYNILNCSEGIGYVYILTRIEFLFGHGFESKSFIRSASTCQLC